MTDYQPPTMVQTDAPDPDWKLTFPGAGVIGNDNAWITVDDLFCVNIIRTDEGIVIDVWPKEDRLQLEAPVATTYAYASDVLPEPGEEN